MTVRQAARGAGEGAGRHESTALLSLKVFGRAVSGGFE
jgi:hypothetical protein